MGRVDDDSEPSDELARNIPGNAPIGIKGAYYDTPRTDHHPQVASWLTILDSHTAPSPLLVRCCRTRPGLVTRVQERGLQNAVGTTFRPRRRLDRTQRR